MNKSKTILFFVTEDWYFISHRLKLALFLKDKGFKIHLCSKDTGKFKTIIAKGINCYDIKAQRKSLSGFHFLFEVLSFLRCIKRVRPNIIHLISLRPAVVGLLASLFYENTKVFTTFTGLGYIFIRKNLVSKILRFFLKIFFFSVSRMRRAVAIVQNKDDYSFFLKNYLFRKNSIFLVRGSGIDLKYFKKVRESKSTKIFICYVGRIIEDKGINFLIEGFKLAKKNNKNICLLLAGEVDNENPTSFHKKELIKTLNSPDIKYLGNVKNVRKLLGKAHIGVLLSKREGLPMSLMEAAALGKPIIATDVPGCREIAVDKLNAITVMPGDVHALKEAILKLANNKSLRLQYGKNSRKIVEGDMEDVKVFKKYLEIYSC